MSPGSGGGSSHETSSVPPDWLSSCLCLLDVCRRRDPRNASSVHARHGGKISEGASAVIPGPLRSFLRMAGISQKALPEEVLPCRPQCVRAQGYQGWQTRGGRTEFLILLTRYVQQSRELAALAGAEGVIRVSGCDDAEPLLRVIGYRVRQECGQKSTSLITADADRAFLTIDSGFPLPQLEETLQGGKPFSHPFPTTRVPAMFTENDWTNASREDLKGATDLVDALLERSGPGPAILGNVPDRARHSRDVEAVDRPSAATALRCDARLLRQPYRDPVRARSSTRRDPGRGCMERSGGSQPTVAHRICAPLARQGQGLAGRVF